MGRKNQPLKPHKSDTRILMKYIVLLNEWILISMKSSDTTGTVDYVYISGLI